MFNILRKVKKACINNPTIYTDEDHSIFGQ